jgi:hypothetical protein
VSSVVPSGPGNRFVMKTFLLIVGFLSALLIIGQLVMGLLIVSGHSNLIKSHQHSGYLTVLVSLLYIGFSLSVIASMPRQPKP